jgi:hypothetical protein
MFKKKLIINNLQKLLSYKLIIDIFNNTFKYYLRYSENLLKKINLLSIIKSMTTFFQFFFNL